MKRYKNKITNQKPYSTIKQDIPLPPLPANNQTGETIVGGIMNSVIHGAALGTGSQLASRGVDAIMGPRKIETVVSTSGNGDSVCLKEHDAYISCMRNGDAEQCKTIFEMLSKCKNINI
jgi:hypothetical protein